ncbi:MAG: malonyl-[acyl-carrier protein] O-methyltransferase BioC [Gammaproteobacteria bacterium]|nr:MAG: malonyl-[acyl-carrier protein] O-methyltransferase BioC [Gammaproteobacteria bacterium]
MIAEPLCDTPRGELAVYHYPCRGEPVQRHPLVLLHGWGSDSRIWQAILPLLTEHVDVQLVDLPGFGDSDSLTEGSVDDYLAALSAVLPESCSLLGWSLGGMLATAFASQYPQRVSHLLMIASNPSFVQRDNWPAAMPITTFDDFCALFSQQPELCLKRFQGLQCRGDRNERDLVKQLRGLGPSPAGQQLAGWQRGLGLLQALDNRASLAALPHPVLHIFGGSDQLVPVETAVEVQALNPCQQVLVLDGVAHVPQLSCPQQLATALIDFLQRDRYRLDKQRVAESFSRAAGSYDSVARLQRQVGEHLLGQLFLETPPKKVLDLGCGTGYFTAQLARRFSPEEMIGVDLAQGMLDYARRQHGECTTWLCDDVEDLSLPDSCVDFAFSNLAFQWCERLPQLAAELARVVKPGGVLAFTSLGQQTLYELRQSWASVDGYVHVNRFQPAEQWQEVFAGAGFDFELFSVKPEVLSYRDLRHLTSELKGLGAHNINEGRNRGMTGRERIRRLIEAYDHYRGADGQLPATWEVIYGVATRHG